jgi:hypothetical protein
MEQRQVSLAELNHCLAEYRKVKPSRMDVDGRVEWRKDYTSLRIAIEHAKAGRVVYVQQGEDGESYYLLSDADTLPAKVCASHIGGNHVPDSH